MDAPLNSERYPDEVFTIPRGFSPNSIADALIGFYGLQGAQWIRVCLGRKLKGVVIPPMPDPFDERHS